MRFKHIDIQPNDRIHMTDEAKLSFKDRNISQNLNSGIGKPAGLWYAMGRTWMEWMERERMDWWKNYLYKIEINSEKVLFLDMPRKVREFAKEYRNQKDFAYNNNINWGIVAQRYSGIEFNPYFYNMRFGEGLSFYYTIDIPSGCIWDKSGIKSITRLN